MKPFFSIIIPLYNKEKHITETLHSVLNQSFSDFEIIIVNDGSTDQSLETLKLFNDQRITVYTTENKGVSHARNYGIAKASASLIVFLDADDYWYPNHLETLKQLHTNFPNCGLYATAYLKKNNNVTIPSVYKNIPSQNGWMGIVEDYFLSSAVNAIAWTSAVMAPKKTLEHVGLFNENITLGAGEDTDLWIRIALKFPVAFCNTATAIHNLHSDNRISNSNTNLRQFIDLDVYEKEAKINASLKLYLDLNRYAIALQYKLVGNPSKAKNYIEKIDKTNLTSKQRFLISLNTPLLKLALKVKHVFQSKGIDLSSFK